MNPMNGIEIIKGVRCYVDENDVPQLNLEDVARGLGFTQVKNGTEYVRWETVSRYLEPMGFSQNVGKDLFIPEPAFYLLAMKADNKAAREFQHTIAYEVLPSIRRHGLYAVDQLLDDPDLAIKAFTALKEERAKRKELERIAAEQEAKLEEQEARLEEQKPLVAFTETVMQSCDTILMRDMAKLLCKEGVQIGEKRLYRLLRSKGVLMDSNVPYQSYIDRGYFQVKEGAYTTPYGTVKLSTTTLVTPRGQIWLVNSVKKWLTGES